MQGNGWRWSQNTNEHDGCTGSPGAVLAKLDGPGTHGDGWTQGQTQTRASRHGVMAEAGKLGMPRQAHAEQVAAAQQADR